VTVSKRHGTDFLTELTQYQRRIMEFPAPLNGKFTFISRIIRDRGLFLV
jgi:hypothetical protein